MSKSLLIIDDEKLICEKFKTILDWEKYGFHHVLCSWDSLRAIELIDIHQPDMIITDISMPGKDGLEIVEYVRSRGMNTCIILISAYDEFEYAQRAIELGVQAYLLKPVTPQMLKEKLEPYLTAQHQHVNYRHTVQPNAVDKRDQLKKTIDDYLRSCIHEKISLSETAQMFYFSAPYFSQLFSKIYGATFTDYVTQLKIEKASQYLTNSQYKVTHIANLLGFSDYRYFSRLFKKYYDCSPLQFRKNHAQAIHD